MKSDSCLKLAVLPGDGIGVDVTLASLPVFDALNVPATISFGDIGWNYWVQEGNPIPERTWKLISECDTTLLGAITSKPSREAQQELSKKLRNNNLNYLSPIIQLRQKLDLFANIRPCYSIQKMEKEYRFCIIRENTEGLYSGFDYYPAPQSIMELLRNNPKWNNTASDELSCSLRLQTKEGLKRLFHYGFEYAETHNHQRVTFADKPNVLRQSSEFARSLFEEVAMHYPHIRADILNVDAVSLWLIKRPEEFGVIVAENMFGDILSDVSAGVMGGLGFAPSANIGAKGSYFEPVHGSAPRIKKGDANPSAMLLSISMLLEHFDYPNEARQLESAVCQVVEEGRFLTYDLGGTGTTEDMAKAIIDKCLYTTNSSGNLSYSQAPPLIHDPTGCHEHIMEQLKKLSTTEISDALDACGIEGALLHIKPLSPGIQLIGPAYTIKFSSYKEKPNQFKNAANYIDLIPENSVIVIDNDGRQDCTAWGAILTKAAQIKGLAGTVVHGAVRDLPSIRESQYPVFSSGTYMRSGKNRIKKTGEQCPLMIHSVTIYPGDIIFGDDNGVLVIPKDQLEDIIYKAQNIQRTEQYITQAIKNGSTLAQARIDFHYDQAWLEQKGQDIESD